MLPHRSLIEKGSSRKDVKLAKERISVRDPRAFKENHVKNIGALPVTYRFNKKAWMTTAIFEEWLQSVNNRMKRERRKILMFLDNAPSHPNKDRSNVKLLFLPPNLSSLIQPLDQGII